MKDFRCYVLAVSFYRAAKSLPAPGHLRSQLDRASSSVVLNCAEGRGKRSHVDQRRFYDIALGSMRECQAILELLDVPRLRARGFFFFRWADRTGTKQPKREKRRAERAEPTTTREVRCRLTRAF